MRGRLRTDRGASHEAARDVLESCAVQRGRFGGLKLVSVGTHAQRGRSGKKIVAAVNSKYLGGGFDSIDERDPRRTQAPAIGVLHGMVDGGRLPPALCTSRGIESR